MKTLKGLGIRLRRFLAVCRREWFLFVVLAVIVVTTVGSAFSAKMLFPVDRGLGKQASEAGWDVPGLMAMGGMVLGLFLAFWLVQWEVAGFPIPKRSDFTRSAYLRRRAAKLGVKIERREEALAQKISASEAERARQEALRERYVKMGEDIAESLGHNALAASVAAHEALAALDPNYKKVRRVGQHSYRPSQ